MAASPLAQRHITGLLMDFTNWSEESRQQIYILSRRLAQGLPLVSEWRLHRLPLHQQINHSHTLCLPPNLRRLEVTIGEKDDLGRGFARLIRAHRSGIFAA